MESPQPVGEPSETYGLLAIFFFRVCLAQLFGLNVADQTLEPIVIYSAFLLLLQWVFRNILIPQGFRLTGFQIWQRERTFKAKPCDALHKLPCLP